MKDEVFGELFYDTGWCKIENLNFWNENLDIKIIVSAYENESPNSRQHYSYKDFKEDIDLISRLTLRKVKKYIDMIKDDIILYLNIDDIPKNIFDILTIDSILFIENGSFAILCSTKWDDHGIGIVCHDNGEIKVGPQDIVWLEN